MYDKIKNEIEKIRRKYIDSAEEIVSGYNREYSLSKDYEGRQIFELLQNADDESANSSGKVLITFDGKKLSISNTGSTFSFRGVKSLLYPNASPKKIHANKIGCKGLGFRSILTWSNSVTVAAEEFTIQFSKEYAREFLKSIIEEKPELRKDIQALSNEEWPIATLTCPHLMDESALVDGFATSIIVECREEVTEEIENQIENLQFEELVFLPNLKEVEIDCNDYHKSFYKKTDGDYIIIESVDKNTGEAECSRWKIYKKAGIIQDENGKDKDYEFILAYDPSGEHQGEVLYSYFKTDIRIGFPALIHGTFELTSDRNSLQKQSTVNKQLIPLLADFMVQTAIAVSEQQQKCDYRPLSLVITSDIDIVLRNDYKLDELLREKVYEKKILPTIADNYISINDLPRYSKKDFANVLNPEVFPTLLKLADDDFIERYLENDLDIDFYEYEDFCESLNNDIENYSMEEKVSLIALVNDEFGLESGEIFPHLIIDSCGKTICDNSKVYPFPNEEQVIDLPEWVDIRFLNQDMEKLLYSELGLGNDRRNLVKELAKYNLEEYSFDRLLRGVVSQVEEDLISKERCLDILNWLWNYYNLEDHQAIQDVKVKVICRDGEFRYAKECYIGKEYGNELGERIIGLYSSQFVALEKLNIECEDSNRIVGFMEWLGASKYPRFIRYNLPCTEGGGYLDDCYPLYVQNDNKWFEKHEFSRIKSITVGFVESFDVIIEKADFNDLLSWFLLDEEIYSRIICETEEKNTFSNIKGIPKGLLNERTVSASYIKSYIQYYLANTKWIPGDDGQKEIPSHCCFEDNALAPFIIVPNVDYTLIKNNVGRACKRDIDAILSRLGIADVFQEMDKKVIYQALLRLPELDTACKKAKSLYRKIIRDGLLPEDYKENNPFYSQFMKEGKVAARKNGIKGFVPISEARYADKKVFSDEILKSFSMFDIDARSGEKKVETLFGVKPLKYTNVEIDGTPKIHPLNELFKEEYLRFVPFVFACRMGLKNASNDFRRLKSSNVILCTDITIKYKFGDEIRISKLNDYERVYFRENNTAYLCVPNKFDTFESMRRVFEFADAVAELITAILDVNEDKDFFRDLFRDNDLDRRKKMSSDRGDDNLELLNEARRRFNTEINPRDEFWMTIAEVLKLPAIEISASTAEELIDALQIPQDLDKDVQYLDLNSFESIQALIPVFKTLELDVDLYNSATIHNIDATKYWGNLLKLKMQKYGKKYQAYLIDDLQGKENCIELYDQYKEEYEFLEPTMRNSLFVNIDEVFENECGVSFECLDSYGENTVERLIENETAKISDEVMKKLHTSYSPPKIEAYLVFGKIDELVNPVERENVEHKLESIDNNGLKELVGEVFSAPSEGFTSITTSVIDNESVGTDSGKHRKQHRKIHLESSDKKKQEIGMIGEACVYKELLKLYPDARWVSGNAEKAGHILKGDDTRGYDIKYTDGKGAIQYVEVKSSRNENIAFSISNSELRFACQNASSYEIIYVVIGDDGKPAHKPWRLGHLFEFDEGEDLLHNERFSIESDSYSIVAKTVEE